MTDVYKLCGDGTIAMLVGKIWTNREVGDKFRLKSCLYQLHVIGKGPASRKENKGEAIYCVYKNELGTIPFRADLFGYKTK